jgi:hypothetical protein
MLLEDLHHHEGPVELVLAGDFLDVLRRRIGSRCAPASSAFLGAGSS